MKHFLSLKLPLLVLGMGAAVLLSPACKAQSEISPDHFDGTDSWAAAAQKVRGPVQNQAFAKASLPAKNQKATQASALQLTSAHEEAKPVNHDAVAIDRKRKTTARDPEKK
ncbi:MAG TPA: hypothetical protein VI431_17625 [Candidatus Acidoferrum sp.]